MIEYAHGPAFLARYREQQRAVLDYAETVAHGRQTGTLTRDDLDALVTAQAELDRLRHAYITATE